MYTGDKARIKVGSTMTYAIDINQGVRQGCILSPLLFNLYLSDFEHTLEALKTCHPQIEDKTSVSCLLWADDIIILSETKSGLQSQLNTIDMYCKTNGLTVNTEKTKCMTFNKAGRFVRNFFTYSNIYLEDVNSFRYLGFLVSNSGNIKKGLCDLKDRALKAFYSIKSMLGKAFQDKPTLTIKLVDVYVKPILLYCSDFWGVYPITKAPPILVNNRT